MPAGQRRNICLFVVLITTAGCPVSVYRCQSVGPSIVIQLCFSQGLSVYLRSPWSALFWRLLWHFLWVLRCFLSARHIPSAWTLRRDQTCRSGRRGLVRVTAVLTQHAVHWPLCVSALMYKTENNTRALGKSLMRNNLVGGCFFSTNQKKAVCVFGSCWRPLGNVVFHNVAGALLWNEIPWKNIFRSVHWKHLRA